MKAERKDRKGISIERQELIPRYGEVQKLVEGQLSEYHIARSSISESMVVLEALCYNITC